MGEEPPTGIPSLDDMYVAETVDGVAMYCDKCGQEIYSGSQINVGDVIVAAASHIREHQEALRVDERG